MLFIFSILAATVFAQSSPPSQGIQMANPGKGVDFRFPLLVTQCEPVFMFYNVTSAATVPDTGFFVHFVPPDLGINFLLIGPFFVGVGYVEWICNIPAGHGLWVFREHLYYIVVQPGSLSSCLDDITITYQYASYDTERFVSFTTARPVAPIAMPLSVLATSTVPFPAGSFSTITINPELIVSTSSSLSPSSRLAHTTLSSHFSSATSSASSRKSNAPTIAGGVIGGIAVAVAIAIAIAIAFRVMLIRSRKRPGRSLPTKRS